jgi:hypothetical protein
MCCRPGDFPNWSGTALYPYCAKLTPAPAEQTNGDIRSMSAFDPALKRF